MRDPRLLEEWALAADARRRAARTLSLSSATASDWAEVERLLAGWWSEVLSRDSLGDAEKADLIERLRAKCLSLSPEQLKLAFTALGTLNRLTQEVDRNVGALLLGESAAAVVRRAPTAVELDRAVRILAGCWEAVQALEDALLRTPAWPRSTATLSVASVSIDGLLGHHFDRVPSQHILVDAETKARARGVLAYFWGHYPDLVLNETSLVRLMLTAKRSWADLATQADALPLRAFRDWLWHGLYLEDDRESILALLRTAPLVFSNDAWTGSTCALAALRASVRYAEKLHGRLAHATRAYPPIPDADAKLKELEETELPAWLKSVAEVALTRADGRLLLILFSSNLVRHDLSPANGQRSWPASRHAFCAIYEALATKPTLEECQRVARIGGVPGNRDTIDFATYLITSALFDGDPEQVWGWYRELLLQSDEDLYWQAKRCHRRSICYFALAGQLAKLRDPFGEWRVVWQALFVTDRERSRFATLDHNALYPSLHLVRVGAELLRQAPSRVGAWQFMKEVLGCACALREVYARRFDTIDPTAVLDVIEVAARIPGGDWRPLVEENQTHLASAAGRIYLSALLLEAGASYGDIESAVEAAPHRLLDTVHELRNDPNVLHLCKFVTDAAKLREPEPSDDTSSPR